MGVLGLLRRRRPAPAKALGGAGGCCVAEHNLAPTRRMVEGRAPAQTYAVEHAHCRTEHCVYRLWMPHRECIVRH